MGRKLNSRSSLSNYAAPKEPLVISDNSSASLHLFAKKSILVVKKVV